MKKINQRVMNSKHLQNIQAHRSVQGMRIEVDKLRADRTLEYTLSDIQNLELIPWAKNNRTIRKIIEGDLAGANLMQAKVSGIESQRRYTVPKRGLIKYLQTYGPALMTTVRTTKSYDPKRRNTVVQKRARSESNASRGVPKAN